MKDKVDLYTIHRNLRCTDCGKKGPVQQYGIEGTLEKSDPKCLQDRLGSRFLSHFGTYGGADTYTCTHCGATGVEGVARDSYESKFEEVKE